MKANFHPAKRSPPRLSSATRFGLSASLVVSSLLAAALLYAFLPTLTQTYGYNDDYPLLWRKVHRAFPVWTNEFAQQGRPLGGLIWIGAFSFPRSLEQLTGVRALALFGAWLLACLQCWHLWRWLRYSAGLAAGLSLATVLSPAFGVLVAWAELWSYPFASVLAYAAGMWTWKWAAENTEPQPPQRRRWGSHALVGLALILSHATYQPSATYFVLAVVAGAFAPRGEERVPPTWRALWRSAAVFAVWTAVYFAAYKGLLAMLGSPKTGATVRAELVSDLGGKLRYLCGPVLWCSLTSWLRLQAFVWQIVAAALVVSGVFGALLFNPMPAISGATQRRFRPDWVSAAALLAALAIAVSPLAVVKENNVSFRTLPTVFAVLIFSALLGWRAVLGQMLSASRARAVAQGAALLVPLLLLILATRHHLHHGITKPNRVELAELRRVLHDRFDRAASPPARLVYVFPSPYIWGSRALRPFAEFGARSSPQSWVAPAMLRLILEERFGGGDEATARTEIFAPPVTADRSNDPVVDGFTLLDGAGATTRDLPRLGVVRILPGGWCVSPWLGAFDAQFYPSIYHPQVGWIYCMPEPTPEIVFAPLVDAVPGWLSTTPERFPECTFLKTGRRARLSLEISPVPRWLDPETGKETSVP